MISSSSSPNLLLLLAVLFVTTILLIHSSSPSCSFALALLTRSAKQLEVMKNLQFIQEKNTERILTSIMTNGKTSPLCVDSTSFTPDTSKAVCRMLGFRQTFPEYDDDDAKNSHQSKNTSVKLIPTANFTFLDSSVVSSTSSSSSSSNLDDSTNIIAIGGLKCPAYAQSLSQCDFTILAKPDCGFYFFKEVALSCGVSRVTNVTVNSTSTITTTKMKVPYSQNNNNNSINASSSPSSSSMLMMKLDLFKSQALLIRETPSQNFRYLCEDSSSSSSFNGGGQIPSQQSLKTICSSMLGIQMEDQSAFPPVASWHTLSSPIDYSSSTDNSFFTSLSCSSSHQNSPSSSDLLLHSLCNYTKLGSSSSSLCRKILTVDCLPAKIPPSGSFFFSVSNTDTRQYTYINSFNGNPRTVTLGRVEVAPMSNIAATGSICDDNLDVTTAQDTIDLLCKNILGQSSSTLEYYRAEAFSKMNSISPSAASQPIYLDDLGCSPTNSLREKNTNFLASNCLYSTTKHDCSRAEDLAVHCTNDGFRSGDWFFKFGPIIQQQSSSTLASPPFTTLKTSFESFYTKNQDVSSLPSTIVSSTSSGAIFLSLSKDGKDSNSPSSGQYGLVCASAGFNRVVAQAICTGAFDMDPQSANYKVENLRLTYSEAQNMNYVEKISCQGTSNPMSFDACTATVAPHFKSSCYFDTSVGPTIQAITLQCKPYTTSSGYQLRLTKPDNILQIRPHSMSNTEKKRWGYILFDNDAKIDSGSSSSSSSSSSEAAIKQKTAEAICSLLYPETAQQAAASPSKYNSRYFKPSRVPLGSTVYIEQLSCPKTRITSLSECQLKQIQAGENYSQSISDNAVGLECYKETGTAGDGSGSGSGISFNAGETAVLRNLIIVVGLCFFGLALFVFFVIAKIKTSNEMERARRRRERAEARELRDFQAALLDNNNHNDHDDGVNNNTRHHGNNASTAAALLLSLMTGNNNNNNNDVPENVAVGQVVHADDADTPNRVTSSRTELQHSPAETNNRDDRQQEHDGTASSSPNRSTTHHQHQPPTGYLTPRRESSSSRPQEEQEEKEDDGNKQENPLHPV